MKRSYVLDACALIALVKNEEGAKVVVELYKQASKDFFGYGEAMSSSIEWRHYV